MTPAIAQYRSVLIIVTFRSLCHVAEELYNSYLLTRSRQDDVRAVSAIEEQAIVTFAKLLGCQNLEFRMTRLLDEIADQVAVTWVLAMDADELRLVWTDMRGRALTIDRRLTVEQTLNINRPSCQEQDHGPDVGPTLSLIFHNHTFFVRCVVVDYPLTLRTNQEKRSGPSNSPTVG